MNKMLVSNVAKNVLCAGVGTGIALGGSKIYQKVTGKPAGCPGSISHVFTNDKLDSKSDTYIDLTKEALKDNAILGLGTVTAVGIAANRNTIAEIAKKVKNTPIKELPAKVLGKLKNVKIKDTLKNFKAEKIINDIKNLPKPIKAGIMTGVALFSIYSIAKAGYIEGQHEKKNLAVVNCVA